MRRKISWDGWKDRGKTVYHPSGGAGIINQSKDSNLIKYQFKFK